MWLEGEPQDCVGRLLAGIFGVSYLHDIVDVLQGGKWNARRINFILCILVIFYRFGPHYVDCGHYFVDFVRSS